MVNIVAAWKGNNPYQGQDPIRTAVAAHLDRDISNMSAREVLLILEKKEADSDPDYHAPPSHIEPILEDDE